MLPDPQVPVAAPLSVEALALRRGIRGSGRGGPAPRVRRTGIGPRRSAAAARKWAGDRAGLAVAGVAGALTSGFRPGDVVVAREVLSDGGRVTCPAAPLVVGTARRSGLTAHCGTFWSAPAVVHGAERERLAARGADVVDMESATFAAAVGERPLLCARAIVDTPERPLLRPGTVTGGVAALRSLRSLAGTLRAWAAALGPHTLVCAPESADLAAFAAEVGVVLLTAAVDPERIMHGTGGTGVTESAVYRVDGPESISLAWLAGVEEIGLVAGAAAPRQETDELAEALRGLGPLTVRPWRRATETTQGTHGEEVCR